MSLGKKPTQLNRRNRIFNYAKSTKKIIFQHKVTEKQTIMKIKL